MKYLGFNKVSLLLSRKNMRNEIFAAIVQKCSGANSIPESFLNVLDPHLQSNFFAKNTKISLEREVLKLPFSRF